MSADGAGGEDAASGGKKQPPSPMPLSPDHEAEDLNMSGSLNASGGAAAGGFHWAAAAVEPDAEVPDVADEEEPASTLPFANKENIELDRNVSHSCV